MSTGAITFDLKDAKPVAAKPISFDLSEAKPVQQDQYQRVEAPSGRGPQSSFGKMFDKAATGIVNAAPAIGSTIGAMAGGLLGGVGGVGGAAAGGGIGEAYKEKVEGTGLSGKNIAEQTALGGASEVGGQVIGKVGGKILAKAAPKLNEISEGIMARIIKPGTAGVKAGGKLQNAQEIASEVNKVAGSAKTLGGLQKRVMDTTENLNNLTQEIVSQRANPAARVKVYDILIDKGTQAIQGLQSSHIGDKGKMIDELVDNIRARAGADELTPEKALELRRWMMRDVNWPAGTRGFKMDVYSAINDEISQALPPADRAAFRANNQSVTRLIRARHAIDAAQYRSIISSGKKIIGHSGAGAATGAAIGGAIGGRKGAEAGAVLGGIGGGALGSDAGQLARAQTLRGASAAASAAGTSTGKAVIGRAAQMGIEGAGQLAVDKPKFDVETGTMPANENMPGGSPDLSALPAPVQKALEGAKITQGAPSSTYGGKQDIATVEEGDPTNITVRDPSRMQPQVLAHEGTHLWQSNLSPEAKSGMAKDDPQKPYLTPQDMYQLPAMRQKGVTMGHLSSEQQASVVQAYVQYPGMRKMLQPWIDDMSKMGKSNILPTGPEDKSINTIPRAPEAPDWAYQPVSR